MWTALTDHEEFRSWFCLSLHGPFKAGEVTLGEVTYPGHEGLPFRARVVVMDGPNCFSFSWPMDETIQPDDPGIDDKVTLAEFVLEPSGKGSRLTVRESGFEKLSEAKPLKVFRDNKGGREAQAKTIKDFME